MARHKSELRDNEISAAPAVSAASVLDALTRAGTPLRPAELAETLGVAPEQREALEHTLQELERTGQVVRNRAGLLLMAARANLLSGQVQGHRDGFGFLIRDDRGPDVVLSESEMSKLVHLSLIHI